MAQRFTQIVEVPQTARHVEFHRRGVPARYRAAVQDVRVAQDVR